jgi:hypothetical protein
VGREAAAADAERQVAELKEKLRLETEAKEKEKKGKQKNCSNTRNIQYDTICHAQMETQSVICS